MNKICYSELSIKLTNEINKIEKKDNGIYFTPPKTINTNIKALEPYMKNIKEILEPSCGSCEYILELNRQYVDKNIKGIEYNKTIYNSIKPLENKNIKLYNIDFLTYESNNKYDLVIGNPPYYVMKKKNIDKIYYNYFDGRPNIFILFIIKSLKLLASDGILSFVLPKNFLNCLYYNKTRKYIKDNYKILNIIDCNDNYIETQQETIILIIKNIKNINKIDIDNTEYTLDIGKFTILGNPENIIKLNSLLINSSTLSKLGFKVYVGNIVWNECKKELTDDNNKTLLVYSSDIKNNKLEIQKYTNEKKKNYIDRKGDKEPLLLINRGYGVGKYMFNYCLININNDMEYLIENHLICIKYIKHIDNDRLINIYEKIIRSFENEKSKEFINLYFGNNAINTTELSELFPIYDI